MDYLLPDGTGAEATRIAKARWPRVRVVMLTGSGGNQTTLESVQAGADGYLTKGGRLDEVVSAVRSVRFGGIQLEPGVIGEIAQRLNDAPRQAPLAQALTGRELEVLRHLGGGRSGRAIAAELNLSPETVRTHIQAIRRKLGASSRLEAVAIALRRGLIEPPGERSC
jgi:DNA-binding NarL/FixJ family response regulator